jgi:hypothetical protein
MVLQDALAAANRSARALLMGVLAAGGHGAAGIPPSSIPQYFKPGVLDLIDRQEGGFPVKSTIIETDLPAAVRLVKARIKTMVRGQQISLFIDGGSGKIGGGRKVMVVCASSPEAEFDLLLDVKVLEAHETSVSNAQQIEDLCDLYEIKKVDVWYVCADNAAVNPGAVDILNTRGFRIRFSRCLPHSLNLVVKAAMGELDSTFKISSNLKTLRSFLNAGGGSAKKLLALEYGIIASSIDFADTRWASLVKAILYVANEQSPASLEKARERLKALAEAGDDPVAAAALAEVDKPEMVCNAIYAFVEGVAEKELAKLQEASDDVEQNLKKSRKDLLNFFGDLTAFAAMQAVDILFGGSKEEGVESLKTIMTITQGDANYANKLTSRNTGVVPHAAQAARALMVMLSKLHLASVEPVAQEEAEEAEEEEEEEAAAAAEAEVMEEEPEPGAVADADDKLERLRIELRSRLVKQSAAVVDRARACEERLCLCRRRCRCEWDELDFEEKDVPAFMAAQKELYPAVEKAVLSSVVRACKTVDGCAGLKKLEECVSALELSQHFDVNVKPPSREELPRDQDVLAYLGATAASYQTAAQLIGGWRSYVASWKKPAAQLSPAAVCKYWRAHAAGANASLSELGKLAIREFSRPISSACCERIFSYLTHMDSSDRQTMGKDLLATLLFLRGNWRLVHIMAAEERDANVERRAAQNDLGKRHRAAVGEAQGRAAHAAAAQAAAEEEARQRELEGDQERER